MTLSSLFNLPVAPVYVGIVPRLEVGGLRVGRLLQAALVSYVSIWDELCQWLFCALSDSNVKLCHSMSKMCKLISLHYSFTFYTIYSHFR